MRIFRALQLRPVRWLWSGQVFSAIGDEVYSIALVWYATNLVGTHAGYISAIQAGSIFVFSVVGGVWADHRDPHRVMMASDLVRGFVVLLLPLSTWWGPLNVWLLIPVAIVVASASAFFEPAFISMLPQLVKDRTLLQTTNGLMEATTRLARVIGPGVVGIVSRWVPLIHYFTLDAISFFISAWSINRIKDDWQKVARPITVIPGSFKDILLAGYRLNRKHPVMSYAAFSGAIVGAAWLFVMPLGMALLLRMRFPAEVGSFGFLISAYGVGNLISNVILTQVTIERPDRLVFFGRVLAGIGFGVMCFNTSLTGMMLSAALAATGGPMTDLGFVVLMQKYFKSVEIAKVHRFNMALSRGVLFVGLVISPKLFDFYTVPTVVLFCAGSILLLGLVGLARFQTVE